MAIFSRYTRDMIVFRSYREKPFWNQKKKTQHTTLLASYICAPHTAQKVRDESRISRRAATVQPNLTVMVSRHYVLLLLFVPRIKSVETNRK